MIGSLTNHPWTAPAVASPRAQAPAPEERPACHWPDSVQLAGLRFYSPTPVPSAPIPPSPLAAATAGACVSGPAGTALTRVLFLSDLDGTWLSPDAHSREQLDRGVVKLQEQALKQGIDLEFGYITARPPARVGQENLPEPDWTVTYNGGTIHRGPSSHPWMDTVQTSLPVKSWEKVQQLSRFDSGQARAILEKLQERPQFSNLRFETMGELVNNQAADDCRYLATFCIDQTSIKLEKGESPAMFEPESFRAPAQLQALLQAFSQDLEKEGMHFKISPVYPFHGKPYLVFDVAAPDANKGGAIDFLRERLGIEPDHVIIAGDGGNDISMMTAQDGSDDGRRSVVVGGNSSLRQAAAHLRGAKLMPPEDDCSLAVLKGLEEHLAEIAAEHRS